MQFGGDDQWSNMLGGTELIRKKLGRDAHAMTITLLLNSEGKKMGKTANGAVWLDAEKTSPYDFFQYWRNVDDADVIKCMKLLTFIPLEEIYEYEKLEGSELNSVKERLAFELTKMIHGESEAQKALDTARSLFNGKPDAASMPTTEISADAFNDGKIGILDVMLVAGLIPSKGEGRRLVQQGGVSVNDVKVSDPQQMFCESDFEGDGIVIKKGKKVFHKVVK